MTYEQRQAVLNIQCKAEARLHKIKAGRKPSELPPADYARHEYWSGKLIGVNDVLRILGCVI